MVGECRASGRGYGIQRIGEVPIYQADPIVRRAESLQRTRDAAEPVAWMPARFDGQARHWSWGKRQAEAG